MNANFTSVTQSQPQARRKPRFALWALITLLFLSACTPVALPESWAGITADGPLENGRYNARYIYVAYRDVVFRVDLKRDAGGRELEEGQLAGDRLVDWAAKAANGGLMFAAPTIIRRNEQTLVFVGSYNHSIYAFSPDVGTRNQPLSNWSAPPGTDKVVANAITNTDLLYVGQGDKGIRAYDLTTGQLRHEFKDMEFGVWATPVLDSATETLYVAAKDQYLYALNAEDLSLLWRVKVGGAMAAQPLLREGVLFVGTFTGEVVAIDVSGNSNQPADDQQDRILRRFKTENGGWVWSTPIYDEGYLYFGDLKGYLYKIDAETFNLAWRVRDEEHPGGIRGNVAVAEGAERKLVIAGSESKHVRAYDAETGSVVWTSTAETERILSDVIVIGDDVIISTMNPERLVVALSIHTGARNWSLKKPSQEDVDRLVRAP
ncbi:MAG: hypothetical protein OHK0023_28000 [Anaerolineae bacterium]